MVRFIVDGEIHREESGTVHYRASSRFRQLTTAMARGDILVSNGKHVDLNLETLKGEILNFLSASEFAVFHSFSGGLEELPVISWDTERFPDYRMFLEAAQKVGQKLILFASREFEEIEVEEALEGIEEAAITRDEQRELERRVRSARKHSGETCTLEMAFDHNSHLYVYEVQPDWYEEFLETCDEITTMLPVGDGGDSEDGLGGFYSNN
jgi:hypothetical protein